MSLVKTLHDNLVHLQFRTERFLHSVILDVDICIYHFRLFLVMNAKEHKVWVNSFLLFKYFLCQQLP